MATFEEYYAANPVQLFDQNQWDVWDPIVAAKFNQLAYWTPLFQYVDLLASPEKNSHVQQEALPGHVNANPIGNRQLYVDPLYFDSRKKKLTGHKHFGQKVQLQQLDGYLNQWVTGGMSTEQYLMVVADKMLAYSTVKTMEHIARNWYLRKAVHKFYGPDGLYDSFADIGRTPSDMFNIAVLNQIKLRLSVRAESTLQQFGTYAQPVPGMPGALSVMTTPGVIHDIWNQKNDFMVDLRALQDRRILHGQQIAYQNFIFTEGPWDVSLLWNAGRVDTQLAVYAYDEDVDDTPTGTTIALSRDGTGVWAGDGAPDPENEAVDGYQYVGQSAAETCHFIVCSPMADDEHAIVPGDRVTIHTTQADPAGTMGWDFFGINYGNAWWDGNSQEVEVYDVINETPGTSLVYLVFREPIMSDYKTELVASGGTAYLANYANEDDNTLTAARGVYAYVTKAQHIHPVVVNAARGAHVFAMTQKVSYHKPMPVDDFEQVWRHTWNMRGAENVFAPDLYEVIFVAGSMGNRSMGISF